MTIIRNSAKCIHCDAEIESTHRHDFNVHYCPVNKQQELKYRDGVWVPDGDAITWNFAVDGGKAYIKRCGDGYVDTSVFEEESA